MLMGTRLPYNLPEIIWVDFSYLLISRKFQKLCYNVSIEYKLPKTMRITLDSNTHFSLI